MWPTRSRLSSAGHTSHLPQETSRCCRRDTRRRGTRRYVFLQRDELVILGRLGKGLQIHLILFGITAFFEDLWHKRMQPSPTEPPKPASISPNFAHETPVCRIVLAAICAVSVASTDAMMGMTIFVFSCLAVIVFSPVLWWLRSYGYRAGMTTVRRRALMLAMPLAFLFWIFMETNRFMHDAVEFAS
jgi:hypothetical protein